MRLASSDPTPLLLHLTHLKFENAENKITYAGILLECLRKRAAGPWGRLKHLTIPWPFHELHFLGKLAQYTDTLSYTTIGSDQWTLELRSFEA